MKKSEPWSTDWLSSKPVFFNRKNSKISHNIFDVFNIRNFELHPEGLKNYLEYGYSVFGQTPIIDVEFLLPNQKIIFDSNNKIHIINTLDPALSFIDVTTTPKEMLEKIEHSVTTWQNKQGNKKIIVPLSGGYDSRILLSFLHPDKKIHAYTYGVSPEQQLSSEVVKAQYVANKLNTQWEHIPIISCNEHIDEWIRLYGPSVHAHGMYHMSFYKSIRKKMNETIPAVVVSGLAGDAWSGNIPFFQLKKSADLVKISYNHGLHADLNAYILNSSNEIKDQYWQNHKEFLQDKKYQALYLVRTKMILLTYLLSLPQHYNFETWTPFLDPDICLGMSCLPETDRMNRSWQKEYFQKKDIFPESANLHFDNKNTLDQQMLTAQLPKQLDVELLAPYLQTKYIEHINRELSSTSTRPFYEKYMEDYYLGALLRKGGIQHPLLKAYYAYLVIKPIESLLRMRVAQN